MASTVSTDELERRVREIVKAGDLDTLSVNGVREQLQQDLGLDLQDRKPEIKEMVLRALKEVAAGNSAPPASTAVAVPTTTTSGADDDLDEPDDLDDDGGRRERRRGKKAHATTTDQPETDEQLARRLQEEEASSQRPQRRAAASGVKRSKTVESRPFKKKSDTASPHTGAGKRAGAGLTAEMVLSAPLAEFIGEAEMSRPQVVKRLWEWIREKGLQDPGDRRKINCDDKLYSIFKCHTMDMFKMNKLLSMHVKKREDMV